ncbi:hypothetical protein FACS189427_09750 [Planctomycetales bacterium]|nr:hypothetical protein FACS189427_09750 [Planctomycetales bacterium]
MKHTIFSTAPVFGLILFIVLSGCTEQRPDLFPQTFPVTMTVTQEGKPLAEASVSLRASGVQWSVGGVTGADGKVKLVTNGYPGAPAGKYKVVIIKQVNEGLEERNKITAEGNGSDKSIADAKKIKVRYYSLVKPEYNSEEKTPVEVEITTSTKNLTVDAGPAVKIEEKMPD